MENRLGSHQTTVDGGQVVHTTRRERLVVWVLLAIVLTLAVGGYLATQAGSGSSGEDGNSTDDSTSEQVIEASETGDAEDEGDGQAVNVEADGSE